MTIAEVAAELETMSDNDKLRVIEVATSLVRKNLNKTEFAKKLSLEEAADLFREDYLYDEELTAVTRALEYEDFIDA